MSGARLGASGPSGAGSWKRSLHAAFWLAICCVGGAAPAAGSVSSGIDAAELAVTGPGAPEAGGGRWCRGAAPGDCAAASLVSAFAGALVGEAGADGMLAGATRTQRLPADLAMSSRQKAGYLALLLLGMYCRSAGSRANALLRARMGGAFVGSCHSANFLQESSWDYAWGDMMTLWCP